MLLLSVTNELSDKFNLSSDSNDDNMLIKLRNFDNYFESILHKCVASNLKQ